MQKRRRARKRDREGVRTKLNRHEVARRQLGTALHLFLDDQDPGAVHWLASAGIEIAEDWPN